MVDAAPNQNHWHYPANFEGAVGDGRSKRNVPAVTQGSGDRWERSVRVEYNCMADANIY
jgi:hypothetical protein